MSCILNKNINLHHSIAIHIWNNYSKVAHVFYLKRRHLRLNIRDKCLIGFFNLLTTAKSLFLLKLIWMFEILKSHIEMTMHISIEDMEKLKLIHKPKKVKKGQVLLFEGQVSKETFYIVKGCLRLYRIDHDGEEHVIKFGIEHWWINDGDSYSTREPLKCYIQALEDSELIIFDEVDFSSLLSSAPTLKKFTEIKAIRSYNANIERIYEFMSLSAETRYNNFVKTYPNIFHRVPLHMIASYLGVSKKTLSRIRSKH
jgi:CRP-like cAMP-binding protein